MYCISICDSDKRIRETLRAYMADYLRSHNIDAQIRIFASGEELSRYQGNTDVVFLGVEAGKYSGIETGYSLVKRNSNIKLIFVADKSNYLDDAMDMKAFRYMTKPVEKLRLCSVLEAVFRTDNEISFISNRQQITLPERSVVCVYSYMRRTYVVNDSGKSYPTTLSIKEWVSRLQGISNFVQPHYSYIVNMKYVAQLNGREITLRCCNGKVLNISASQRMISGFRARYYSYK